MSDRISSLLTGTSVDGRDRTGLAGDLYRIADIDRLRPFLVSVVSDCDLWMYLSSAGALTAGRANEDRSLFPYETDDKLHTHAGITGPMTMLRVHVGGNGRPPILWKPFESHVAPAGVRRSMSKSVLSNRVVFEERHEALGLTFRYTWQACDALGWVRSSELEADEHRGAQIDILDGVVNLLPAHADLSLQRSGSCLINAYTQCELDVSSTLAIYSLTSRITDKAEPSEALFANIAFQVGLPDAKRLLSTDQLEAFCAGRAITDEHLMTGRRGAFLITSSIELGPGEKKRWRIALDAYRDATQVAELQATLATDDAALNEKIDRSLRSADAKLSALVAAADSQQHTADAVASAHHTSNVLFNCLRGGAFLRNDELPSADFARGVAARNRAVARKHRAWLDALPATIRYGQLLGDVAARRDPQLLRLAMEYLPLTFGRRHGDPSRPWNRFDIRVTNDDGSPALSYQGNWRDIFQNWEALAVSYPVFLESMIAKFVNASTVDGFNPYRVTRDGIEWEVPDPHDPWSHIGYWGDHQLIYLLKLLEASRRTHPDALDSLLSQKLFAYADVPYRMKSHAAILENRRDTIEFDWPRHREIESRLREVGTDARLVRDAEGGVLQVTLAEKLLVPALSKLSNLVPGVGIWMNTQRPEWNDANNALVGNGVSVVTLCYLRRYCAFCLKLFAARSGAIECRTDVATWLDAVGRILSSTPPVASDREARRAMFDALGSAFEAYRATAQSSPAKQFLSIASKDLISFFESALRHVDASIANNTRRDGLYHAYNLLHVKDSAIDADTLPPMLEGQVAVLSSGLLTPTQAADVVERMFASPLWRADQQSFMLYPIHESPGFLQKSGVDEMAAMRSAFARKLLQAGERSILHRDVTGQIRFHASFRNAKDVEAALATLAARPEWSDPTGREEILDLYEQTFRHHAFTGRSGTMYGYEGIGCIYWHMVAKLLLAVQENVWRAYDASDQAAGDRLALLYSRVRAGLGFNKQPDRYGAFPLDAYSHTPLHAGAQQPGMTGQVKEEILTRFGEFGVRVSDGVVRFAPILLTESEFVSAGSEWSLLALDGATTVPLHRGTLGFTFAGVPIIYRVADEEAMTTVESGVGERTSSRGSALSPEASRSLLSRDGSIARVEVVIPRKSLRRPSPAIELAISELKHQESGASH